MTERRSLNHYERRTPPGRATRTWPRGKPFPYDPAYEVLIECQRCGRKISQGPMKALRLHSVRTVTRRPWANPFGNGDTQPEESWNLVVATCADDAECRAYIRAKMEKARKRTGTLVWCESRFKKTKLPKGSCHWCGEPIVLVDPTDARRRARQYHRGDEHEVGEHDCRRQMNRSYAFNARDLIALRGDPCCIYCGSEDPSWEAEHIVPIADGGEHDPTNIGRSCVPCHRAKTKREARERAQRRRGDSAPQLEMVSDS